MRSRGNKFGDCYLPLISECGRETETEKAAGTFSEQPSGFRPSGVEGLNIDLMGDANKHTRPSLHFVANAVHVV